MCFSVDGLMWEIETVGRELSVVFWLKQATKRAKKQRQSEEARPEKKQNIAHAYLNPFLTN